MGDFKRVSKRGDQEGETWDSNPKTGQHLFLPDAISPLFQCGLRVSTVVWTSHVVLFAACVIG